MTVPPARGGFSRLMTKQSGRAQSTAISWKRLTRWIAFLSTGIPAFLLALGFNYLLVRHAQVPAVIAYGPVLLMQMLVNYSICRSTLFSQESSSHPFWPHFGRFLSGSLVVRLADWSFYGLLTFLGLPYWLAQVINVILFSILRFRFVEWLFSGRPS